MQIDNAKLAYRPQNQKLHPRQNNPLTILFLLMIFFFCKNNKKDNSMSATHRPWDWISVEFTWGQVGVKKVWGKPALLIDTGGMVYCCRAFGVREHMFTLFLSTFVTFLIWGDRAVQCTERHLAQSFPTVETGQIWPRQIRPAQMSHSWWGSCEVSFKVPKWCRFIFCSRTIH